MALYEYQCDACGHRFEIIQKWSDPPQETCPKCGGTVRKLQSAPAFQFKGTGWYVTDYAKKDQGGTDKGGDTKDAKSSSESSGSDKSEKSEKVGKPETAGKSDKPATSEKGDKPSDGSKAASSGDSSSSGPAPSKSS